MNNKPDCFNDYENCPNNPQGNCIISKKCKSNKGVINYVKEKIKKLHE